MRLSLLCLLLLPLLAVVTKGEVLAEPSSPDIIEDNYVIPVGEGEGEEDEVIEDYDDYYAGYDQDSQRCYLGAESLSSSKRTEPKYLGAERTEAKYFYYRDVPVPIRIYSSSRVTHQASLMSDFLLRAHLYYVTQPCDIGHMTLWSLHSSSLDPPPSWFCLEGSLPIIKSDQTVIMSCVRHHMVSSRSVRKRALSSD